VYGNTAVVDSVVRLVSDTVPGELEVVLILSTAEVLSDI
jgi:hypothetical protein